MSLLDKASLIVTPNAYKESKLYSVVPSSGAGDMNVVRATTATRVNSAGLIEVVPRNLISYSEDVTNTDWFVTAAGTGTNPVITANYTTSPTGTNNADRVQFSNVGGSGSTSNYSLLGKFPLALSSTGTATVYLKSLTSSNQNVLCYWGAGQGTVFVVTPQWQRFTLSNLSVSDAANFFIGTRGGNSSFASGGDATLDIAVWGAQLENFATATEYFPTTTRLNIPRIDYTNGSCPSLLVEPQRTNISSYVEAGTGGFLSGTIASASNILGLKAFKVTIDIGTYGDNCYINTNSDYQANTAYTISYYTDFSKCTGSEVGVSLLGFFPSVAYAGINVNKTTKAITTFNVGGVWTINSSSAKQISGQIYKITCTATPSLLSLGGSRNYITTDNLQSLEVSGIQVEAGSYPTSFINKPSSASATRNADVISKTGISSLIGQTEGTLFLEYFNKNGLANIPFRVIGSDGKIIWIRGTGAMFFGNSSALLFNNYGTPTANQKYKIAFVYGQNDFRLYVNGSLISSVTSGTFTGSFNDIQFPALPNETPFGDQFFVNSLQLYKTKLSNIELAQLTTL